MINLEAMRKMVLDLLGDTAEIQEPTIVKDPGGGFTETWATINTVPCRVDPLRTNNTPIDVEGRQEIKASFVITLPHDTVLKENYRIKVDNKIYEIESFSDDHTWNISVRVYASRLEEM